MACRACSLRARSSEVLVGAPLHVLGNPHVSCTQLCTAPNHKHLPCASRA